MAVDACRKPKLMDGVDDDDDEPIVFRRKSTLTKQNCLDADTKRPLSSNPDRQMGKSIPDARSPITPSTTVQKSKMVSPSSIPGGTRSWKSSSESSLVKSSQIGSRPSTSVTHQPKPDKHRIKDEQSNEVTDEDGEVAEDSEDDKPLSARVIVGSSNSNNASKAAHMPKNQKSEHSDDEVPLSAKFLVKPNVGESTKSSYTPGKGKISVKHEQNGVASTDRKPSTISKKRLADTAKSSDESCLKKPKISDAASAKASAKPEMKEEDDEDHVPISHRMKKSSSSEKKSSSDKNLSKPLSVSMKKTAKKSINVVKSSQYSKSSKVPPSSGEGKKWTTLEHNGVIFPPPYKPHGVKMLYKGKPVDLTPAQEEVATMFAGMLDTDYMAKPQFKENFMNDWRKILGKNHIIQHLEHCDFTPIYEWIQKDKEKKKQMTSEEKKAQKEEKLKQEEKYMWAVIDGVKEKVGNFRVEPPGLFRGRGEHPKMGKLKKRIFPSDITINIGKGAKIPECPIPGERWKEIRHDDTVSWLAYWSDPINPKEFKYVFLAASSSLKGQSDKEKYEKARLLKDYILGIRETYTKHFTSKDPTKKQIAVATYLIDKLALRAGNEKDEDEADTVGCCTLKFQHVVPEPPNILKFDFKGKDSIDYRNDVEVETAVFKAIQQFRNGKKKDDPLFDKLDTSKLNAHLKELMPGLTAKVFRTYNASITLDDKLSSETKGGDVTSKMLVYQHANKEVAIICNHQRTVSKNHGNQMTKLNLKIEELKAEVKELQKDLSRAREGKSPLKSPDGKPKKNFNPETLTKRIAKLNATIEAKERDKESKEDLKTVALGTSKINYLDPRITVAWCKRHEVPIEKMFNKSLLAKFAWAMDVDPSFRF